MKHNRLLLVAGSAILLSLLMVGLSWYLWLLTAGLFLLAFLPGYALLTALWPPTDATLTGPERWLMAVPVSYALTITLLLPLAFLKVPLNGVSLTTGLLGLTLLLTGLAWRLNLQNSTIPVQPSTVTRSVILWLMVILLAAAFFRVINLHYSDLQGDEADILFRAVWLGSGQPEAMLTHSKGPGEILLLNVIGGLTGQFDELTARLPFALAGTASIGLLFLLGTRLFNRQVGIAAGLLAAIDGVFISYARTAQYQSVVLLLTLTAIYAFYRFYQTDGQSRRWHGLGAFLLAAAFLFHFETVLLLPVAAYLTFAPALSKKNQAAPGAVFKPLRPYVLRFTIYVLRLWPSILIFITLVASFYLPFLLNPNVKSTGVYLENRVSAGSLPPFNNLAHFFYYEALKYNSAYYVLLFTTALAGVIVALLSGAAGRRKGYRVWGWLAAGFILGGMTLAFTQFAQLATFLLALGFTLFFALVILSPGTAVPHRPLSLWLAPPFLVYVFLVNRPGKHHYLFLGALVIWVGWAIVGGWQWSAARWPILQRPLGRWLAVGLSVGLLALFAGHSAILFLRSDLEYILTFPAHQSALYPTDATFPYDARIGFGYPFRLGWQLIGQLRRTGQLVGDWAGNDDGNAPRWYMLGEAPTPCYPRYVLRGEVTYKGAESFDVPFDPATSGYVPRYRLWGNNRLRLTVLEFDPTGQTQVVDLVEPARFEPPVTAADFAPVMSAFPPQPQVRLEPPLTLGEGSELKNNAPPEYLERAKQLNGRVVLLGYDVDERYANPGSMVPLTLYWQAQTLLSLRYKVFLHLIDSSGRNWVQADDFPVCGTAHANTWEPGQIIQDRHLLKLPPDLPPGDYTLLAGMYEPDLNLRLNYFDVAGNEQGNSLNIGRLSVETLER